MELLSDMSQRLLEELAASDSFVSGKELAERLDTSPKTVYRAVREINAATTQGEIIASRRGLGYRLVKSQPFELKSSTSTLTPVGRRREIVAKLLRAAPDRLDFDALCDQYCISESLLRADLKIISKEIMGFGLALRREHWQVWIEGTEVHIRQALSSLVDVTALETMYIDPGFIESSFEESDLAFARHQVAVVEQELGTTLPNPYDINLASHIYVMVARSRRHESSVTPELPVEILGHDDEAWNVAALVVENVQNYLGIEALTEEIPYIYAYLVSARTEGARELNQKIGSTGTGSRPTPWMAVTEALIDVMSAKTGHDFSSLQLKGDLARHIRPLLNRLRYGISISNPVVAQVRAEYLELFEALEVSAAEVFTTPAGTALSDDEIGFLTLYFAREVESHKRPVRVVVCCSTGIGTSELLRVKIEKFFPEVRIVGLEPIHNLTEAYLEEHRIELVISTIRGVDLGEVPVIVVDVMLTERSQDIVRQALRRF